MAHAMDTIIESVGTDYRLHVGGNYYVETMKFSDKIHLVKYEELHGNDAEDLYGNIMTVCVDEYILLTPTQFNIIISKIHDIDAVIPELSLVVPCYMRDDHQNQEGAAMCVECNPPGVYHY